MQRFRQLSVPLDFGGTGPGFTITLTGPSYIVERLSPRTEPSGIEPLKPMIHFLDPEPTGVGSPPPPVVGVKSFGG